MRTNFRDDVVEVGVSGEQEWVLPGYRSMELRVGRGRRDLPLHEEIDHHRVGAPGHPGSKKQVRIDRRDSHLEEIGFGKVVDVLSDEKMAPAASASARICRSAWAVPPNLPPISPVGARVPPNRRRTTAGETAREGMCRKASRSAVLLHTHRNPLGGPPAISRVRETGLARMFASRKTRTALSTTEEISADVVTGQLDDVTHRGAPEPFELLERDPVSIADLDCSQLTGRDPA